MPMEDFLASLNGGMQGAGMGASLLGGMGAAKIGAASNPWVAGSLLAGGTALGLLNSMDPSQKRASRLNERLGNQEAQMNDLNITAEKTKLAEEERKRRTFGQFGALFSNYIASMAKAKPNGQAAFAQDLGGI